MGMFDDLGKAFIAEAARRASAHYLDKMERETGPNSLSAALARHVHAHAHAYDGQDDPLDHWLHLFAGRPNGRLGGDQGARYVQQDLDAPSVSQRVQLLRKAADLNHPIGLVLLGQHYLHGLGVPLNQSEGARLVGMGSGFGNPEACYLAGTVMADLPDCEDVAFGCFLKAANLGQPDAMWRLALCYAQGKGVPENAAQFERWFNAAIAAGQPDAIALRRRHDEQARQRQSDEDAARRRQEEEARRRQQEQAREQQQRTGPSGRTMTRKQALDVLELREGATRSDIVAAYDRMVARNRNGGSAFIIRMVTQARDTLL